ncbi:aminopeptidase [Candidatus Uabimicrobium amorphum]|uniref:Leucyl aminopeptidase n=1 Tax=Uabimicrobium amorphum TaxID=2596890 RepID=A0A5S9IJG9_UABAM|nr:aminopeptidase [Candidatus Uabimicrobium amorphum]BBM82677.1 leucyl aminopeptidase [Candidatus Uabimicrobium amorphum]
MNNIDFPNICELDKVAKHIVNKCLRVKENEIVNIRGGIHQYPLLAKIQVYVHKSGGYGILDIRDDETTVSLVNDVGDDYVGKIPEAVRNLQDHIDVDFILHPNYSLEVEKRKDTQKNALRNKRIAQYDRERTSRALIMEWPTIPKAKTYGMSLEQLQEIFWRAFWVDLDKLTAEAATIKEKLQGAKKVVVTSENGKTLEFAIGERPIWIDTGCFTEELVAAGDLTKNLPCGEVYCSPIEDSANGTVLFQKVFYNGNWIRNLELTFEEGRVTQVNADEGEEIFEEVLGMHSGDKDCIAELGIGLNPNVPETIGNILLDEKVVGSIHIAIGKNTMYGGINKSSLHWDLVAMHPTVTADGRTIMQNGKLELTHGN